MANINPNSVTFRFNDPNPAVSLQMTAAWEKVPDETKTRLSELVNKVSGLLSQVMDTANIQLQVCKEIDSHEAVSRTGQPCPLAILSTDESQIEITGCPQSDRNFYDWNFRLKDGNRTAWVSYDDQTEILFFLPKKIMDIVGDKFRASLKNGENLTENWDQPILCLERKRIVPSFGLPKIHDILDLNACIWDCSSLLAGFKANFTIGAPAAMRSVEEIMRIAKFLTFSEGTIMAFDPDQLTEEEKDSFLGLGEHVFQSSVSRKIVWMNHAGELMELKATSGLNAGDPLEIKSLQANSQCLWKTEFENLSFLQFIEESPDREPVFRTNSGQPFTMHPVKPDTPEWHTLRHQVESRNFRWV